MRKIAITIGVIIGILVIAKTLGLLVNYTLPTSSNEPTIHVNSHIFASSLIKPKVGDFATFKPPLHNVPDSENQIYVKRLCALGGDEIEMRNGVFFRNGENFDSNLSLQHSFIVTAEKFTEINKKYPILDFVQTDTVYQIQTTDKIAAEFGVLGNKNIQTQPGNAPPIFIKAEKSGVWTRDNFGPLTVPEGMSFFMGDNRHYSYDCRYFGFVSNENVTGTIFGY